MNMDMMKKLLALAVFAMAGGMVIISPLAGAADWPPPLKEPLYKVVDGVQVDPDTMQGFRVWRQAACDRCHGPEQQGLVGPSLLESLKTLTYQEFAVTIRDGRLEKGMQSFGTSEQVMNNIAKLYAYLKGRSDGAIKRAKVQELESAESK
jgi:mono/diheme cytochrome c family protein